MIEDTPISDAGRVAQLRDRGYSTKQIGLELNMRPPRVNAILRKLATKSLDSRRIFEIHEMLIEVLTLLRAEASAARSKEAARMRRTLERRDLPRKLGAAAAQQFTQTPS